MLSFFSCSKPRAVIVKCDGCAYDVDVSNRHLLFSQYLLNMCSELLVMNLYIRVLGFASTKVMSLFYKPFDRYIDPWHRVFCFGHLGHMFHMH